MKKFEFKLPDLAEQQAIIAALSDMDTEIAALEARRDKTRALKQGMMQELLTGRIRLVEPKGVKADSLPQVQGSDSKAPAVVPSG